MFPAARSIIIATLLTTGASAQSVIDFRLAGQYFGEAQAACSKDAGKLWGVSLCGPMIFVEPQSRSAIANQKDAGGFLHEDQGVYVGAWPKELNVANTAVTWSGTRWTQLRWPIAPKNLAVRQGLLVHEMFHRVQEQLGFKAASPGNAHLDSEPGRVQLRAEMRALRVALESKGAARRRAALDALRFRAQRQRLFRSAAEEENALELNEGLCEYTGIKLSRTTETEQIAAAAQALLEADKSESYVRSFAYATGPAYGILLDALYPRWRAEILRGPVALAALLQQGAEVRGAGRADDRLAGTRYGLPQIRAEESERAQRKAEQLAAARARFIDGPILVIALTQAQVQFDPNNPYPFADYGTVYPNLRISDQWGVLDVTSGGALLSKDWSNVTVAADGEGWSLELKPGWSKKAGPRAGDMTITKD